MPITRRHFLASVAASPLLAYAAKPVASDFSLYIGAYTNGASKGILHARFDSRGGTLGTPELAIETPNPTFLAIHRARRRSSR